MNSRAIASLLTCLLTLGALGCGGAGSPARATAPASFEVSASAASALVSAAVTITATVRTADGSPVAPGLAVGFTVSGGTLLVAAPTDVAGRARAVVTSATPGRATVFVTAGALPGQTADVRFIDPDAVHAISVSASASEAGLGSPVILTATVVPAGADGAGGPGGVVPDGTVVAFSATSGVVSAVTTTVRGEATAILGEVASPAVVLVDASAGGVASAPAVVSFVDLDSPSTVTVTADPPAGYTGGQRSVTLTAQALSAAGGPVAAGTPVAFAVTAGEGHLSAAGVLTDALGRATVVLDSEVEGPVTVGATVAATVAGQATVYFSNPSRPVALQLIPDAPSGHTDGQRPVTLTAEVGAASGGPAPAGTPVAFAVTAGAGQLSAASASTDAAGRASVVLDSSVEGPVTISATAGGAVTGRATVTFSNPSRPAAVQLAASAAQGVTRGQRLVTLTATVTPADPVNGRIADGTQVRFAIVGGAGTLSSSAGATTAGAASVTLDSSDPGTVTVVARAGSAPEVSSGAVSTTFIAQPTLVTVRVRITGSLPAGALVGGVSAVVLVSPSASVSLSAADVSATGAASGALLVANPGNPAAAILALVSATGFQPGEFATLVYRVSPGSFPSESAFGAVLSGPGVIDAGGATIPLGVAVQSVTVQ